MTKEELLAKIQEICPEAFISNAENGGEEIFIATGLVEHEEGAELISINDHVEEPRILTKRVAHYFAEDGNFGEANGLVVIETTDWNENDWNEIDEVQDEDRPQTAEIISKKYKTKN